MGSSPQILWIILKLMGPGMLANEIAVVIWSATTDLLIVVVSTTTFSSGFCTTLTCGSEEAEILVWPRMVKMITKTEKWG